MTSADDDWITEIELQAKKDVFATMNLGLEINEYGHFELLIIRVPVTHRGAGHGERTLAKVCAEADRRGLILTCSPTDERGADLDRLIRWYARHGFIPANDSGVHTHNTYVRRPR